MPDDATVPMRRSDHPPSMPPEDAWGGDSEKDKDASAAQTRENPAQTASPNPPAAAAPSPKPAPVAANASPKPAPVVVTQSGKPPPLPRAASVPPPAAPPAAAPAQVVTDANSLRNALEEILGPMQKSIDDLTVRMARERVDRKEAIEQLEKTIARISTATPPPVQVAPATAAHAPPVPAPSPVAQPFSVSPSAHPPPVAPVAAARQPSPAPPPVAPSPVPPPVAAKPPSPKPAPVAPREPPSQPLNLDVIEGEPNRIELAKYSTDLGFDLPPGLDTGRRKKRMAVFVTLLIVGGLIAIIASAVVSQSRGAGHTRIETTATRSSVS